MTNVTTQSVVVTVSADHAMGDVVKGLKAAGLKVDQVLDAINVVTGTSQIKSLEKLRRIVGVVDVSSDHDVNIGPPGAPVS